MKVLMIMFFVYNYFPYDPQRITTTFEGTKEQCQIAAAKIVNKNGRYTDPKIYIECVETGVKIESGNLQ